MSKNAGEFFYENQNFREFFYEVKFRRNFLGNKILSKITFWKNLQAQHF